MIRTEGLSKNIPPYQAVHTVMYLNPSRFPGKLHLLPAGSFDPVVFYQQVGGKHACNAAHSGIADFTASHHRMPDDLILPEGMVPALVADINPHAVRPVNFTILNDPVVSSVA